MAGKLGIEKLQKAQASVHQGEGEGAAKRNEKIGTVVSTRMAKTIVVKVDMRKPHPLYKRVITRSRKFYAHDEQNACQIGDVVRIIETRPLSKLKRWRLEEVIRRMAIVPGTERLGAEDMNLVAGTGTKG